MINRRRVMQATVLGGAAVAAGPAGCSTPAEQSKSAAGNPATEPFPLNEVTVAQKA